MQYSGFFFLLQLVISSQTQCHMSHRKKPSEVVTDVCAKSGHRAILTQRKSIIVSSLGDAVILIFISL